MRLLVLLVLCGCGDQAIQARDTAPEPPISEFGDLGALTGPSVALFSDNEGLYTLQLADGSTQAVATQTAFHPCLSPDQSLVAWGDRSVTITPLEPQGGKLIDTFDSVERPVGFIDNETLLFQDENLMSDEGLNIMWIRGDKAGYGTHFFDDLPDDYRIALSEHPLNSGGSKVIFATGDDDLWRVNLADTGSFPNFGYDYHDLESYTVGAELHGCVPLWHPDGGVVCATETDVVFLDGDLERTTQLAPQGGIKDAEVIPIHGGILYRDNDNFLLMTADFASGEATRFKAWDELNNVDLASAVVSDDGETVLFASAGAIYRGTADGMNLFRVRGIDSPVRSLVW